MLLNLLSRKEKLKFLDLALHMVVVDGEPDIYETRMLNMMLAEVGDNIVKEYTFSLSDNLEETLHYFIDSPQPIKHIVFLNLLKVSLFDDFYNATEHFLLEDIKEKFNIKEQKKKQLMQLIFDERDLSERAKRVVSF